LGPTEARRPADRLPEDLEAMAPLAAEPPDFDQRIVLRVPADPHVRVDTCDYSLDPRLVGRRVEVRVGMSNPEIAQALFVTRKTVEMHLGNVFRKLGVRSRQALASALGPREAP
jgi:DNA-binding NarL/FixJ family response regulator